MPPSSTNSASLRRQTRLRREYLYKKSLEGRDRAVYEQKQQLRQALASGKSLPTELRASYDALKKEVDAEDVKTDTQHTRVDDEYGDAGLIEPRVCVTTCRDPSSRLKNFSKELKLLVPNSTRINRGNNTVSDLMQACRQGDFTDVVIVQETRGEPDGLVVCHLPLGPTAFFSLNNTVMRHDLDPPAAPMSEAYPHLILNNFNTDLGKRVGNILKCLFPVPRGDSKRVITFANQSDFISFRHHMYSKPAHDNVALHEVGPRFEMKLYQIRLGTLEQTDADSEYVLRPYQNTASKRNVL
ncbi:nucleolar ribonucleoprotein protein IMP4 [Seminavis robusta]|uniref:Nucleolar ribonucleoprotein protein IMP4 n=1 Tax=Seminavis robusta TaxID=568900 RepID=A0A9N8HN01_9STRA|nr:nucleolar ribonucleoprotein protein IMP4 [Seminavis robusta]|eukprot:Sro946_g223250.1 nucleolar ribonucleoprotein protein IMP4 (298) ;mRNA; f:16572-17465